MLNRKPLVTNPGEPPVETGEVTGAVAVTSASPAASVAVSKDALAGAFPAWDLLPPDAFVKRVMRKKMGEAPTL